MIKEKTRLPDQISLNFFCDIHIVGSEFGIYNIKAEIHPFLYQQFIVGDLIAWRDIFWCFHILT